MDSVADLISVGTAGVSTAVRRLDCEDRNGSGGWGASGRIIDDDDDDIDEASFKMLLVCATLASSEIVPLSSNVPATLNALPAANACGVIRIANKLREGTHHNVLYIICYVTHLGSRKLQSRTGQ